MMPQSRDRRPRLSAHLPFHDIPLGNIPSFGEAWGGFYRSCFGGQTRASVPTAWCYLQSKERPSTFEEGVSLL
ncbi:MAG: hypothetical protein ACTTKT_04470 [Prevotella veroralis]